jgi:hypothetical protein
VHNELAAYDNRTGSCIPGKPLRVAAPGADR